MTVLMCQWCKTTVYSNFSEHLRTKHPEVAARPQPKTLPWRRTRPGAVLGARLLTGLLRLGKLGLVAVVTGVVVGVAVFGSLFLIGLVL